MNLQQERLQSLCHHLKLTGLMSTYLEVGQKSAEQGHSYADFLEHLLTHEVKERQSRTRILLTQMAGFPALKTLDDFDPQVVAGVTIKQLANLGSLSFIERCQNIIILGPSGVGKTHLAI